MIIVIDKDINVKMKLIKGGILKFHENERSFNGYEISMFPTLIKNKRRHLLQNSARFLHKWRVP